MKKNLPIVLISLLYLGLIVLSPLMAAEKLIVFVKPFEAKGVPEFFASNATALFRSELSATNRVQLVSEEEWRNVMQAQGILLKSIAIFDAEIDQQIGKLVSADKLVTGSIEQSDKGFLINVNWIDIVRGIIEKPITKEMRERGQLKETINKIILELERMFVPGGKIISVFGERIKIRPGAKGSEWQVGAIFDLKKPSGVAYGKVRIEKIERDEAIGLTFELKDFLTINDLVELSGKTEADSKIKYNVGLLNFDSNFDKNYNNDLYVQCQTQLRNSNRFNLFDAATVAQVMLGQSDIEIDYIVEGEIINDKVPNSYTATIRMRELRTEQIEEQDTEKCLNIELEKTIRILLHTIISHFPLRGSVIKIDEQEITVDLGSDQNLVRKRAFIFKTSKAKTIIAGRPFELSSVLFYSAF